VIWLREEHGWAFSIRELVQLWCRSQQQVRQILDEESIAHRFQVVSDDLWTNEFKKTVVLAEDAVRIYRQRVFQSLPPHIDPLTPDEADFLFLVLERLASDGALGTAKVISKSWPSPPISQIQGDARAYWVKALAFKFPGADRHRVYRALRSFRPDRSAKQADRLFVD
jgi:hypothetical protein